MITKLDELIAACAFVATNGTEMPERLLEACKDEIVELAQDVIEAEGLVIGLPASFATTSEPSAYELDPPIEVPELVEDVPAKDDTDCSGEDEPQSISQIMDAIAHQVRYEAPPALSHWGLPVDDIAVPVLVEVTHNGQSTAEVI